MCVCVGHTLIHSFFLEAAATVVAEEELAAAGAEVAVAVGLSLISFVCFYVTVEC